jgi:hypothetical protein
MGDTTAAPVPSTNGSAAVDPRERAALAAFVVVAVVATLSWLALLGWLVVLGLRAVGV